MHLVIDCNPGIDDALAIALCLAHRYQNVKLEAITLVDGFVSLSNSLNNLAITLQQCERIDIPVYKGSNKPLLGFDKMKLPPPVNFIGENGFGVYPQTGLEFTELNLVLNKSAAEGLVELARKYPGKLHIISLGPLTNIAMAIRMDPHFSIQLGGLHVMGGDYGNAFKRYGSEMNFCKDPESANIVMREAVGVCPVTLIPYDTCFVSTENCHWDWFDYKVNDSTKFGHFIHKLFVPYRNNVKHLIACSSLAMTVLLFPDSITEAEELQAKCSVKLEQTAEPMKTKHCLGGLRGCLVLEMEPEDESNSPKTNGRGSPGLVSPGLRIVTKVDEHIFKTHFAEAMEFYSKKSLPHYGY